MSSRFRPYLPILAVVAILVGIGVIVKTNSDRSRPAPAEPVARSTRTGGPPNILVVMTDDQTLEAMRVLDNVNKLIVKPGTSFTNYFVSFPNCCPSRATYMTGQFAHNDHVRDNLPPNGGFHNLDTSEYLPVWLQRSGYWTSSVGKFLNQWGDNGDLTAPKGWSHWFGLIDPTTYHYYGYSVSNDGVRQDYGHDPQDYQTDVLGAEVVRIIKDRATSDQPWFLSWTPLAPHAQESENASGNNVGDGNDNDEGSSKGKSVIEKLRATLPVPAEKYKGKFAKETLPKPASFNEKDVSQKPTFVQKKFAIGFQSQGLIREGYEREFEALQSVDEWVGKIFNTLDKTNQLANTVVVFTSDNGYYHGEHRLTFSKVYLYEPGVHLPLAIRGGGFPKATKVEGIAGNVDLTPTILGIAGAKAPDTFKLDGRDLATIVKDPAKGEGRGMLLENWTDYGNAHTSGIRTDRWKYLNNEKGEEELYDLQNDPDELHNLANDAALTPVKAELRARAAKLDTCAGETCEGADGHGG